MIKGGSNGSLQSGNIRSGYSDLFLPAKIFLLPPAVIEKYNNNSDLNYSFEVYAKNDAGWVLVSAAISFGVEINPDGKFNTASVIVKDTQTWAIKGSEHTNLLKPGNTQIKITGNADGISDFAFFTGRLTGYNRSEAFGSATISLTCTDVRSLLQRAAGAAYSGNQTSYRNIKRQLQTPLRDIGLTFAPLIEDTEGTFYTTGSRYVEVNRSVNGQGVWAISAAGNMFIGSKFSATDQAIDITQMIQLTDTNIITGARVFGDFSTYNTVKIAGFVGAVYTVSSVEDAADVAVRGNVWYAPGIIGTPTIQLSASRVVAENMISNNLNPKFDLSLPFFPFFEAGQQVYMQSDTFNIPASITTIGKISHTYQQGSTSTSLNALYITEL